MLKKRLLITLLIIEILAYVHALIFMVFVGELPYHLQFFYANLIIFPLLTVIVRITNKKTIKEAMNQNIVIKYYMYASFFIILCFIFIPNDIYAIFYTSLSYLIVTIVYHVLIIKDNTLKLTYKK